MSAIVIPIGQLLSPTSLLRSGRARFAELTSNALATYGGPPPETEHGTLEDLDSAIAVALICSVHF
jgi:hypothetical protein